MSRGVNLCAGQIRVTENDDGTYCVDSGTVAEAMKYAKAKIESCRATIELLERFLRAHRKPKNGPYKGLYASPDGFDDLDH